jgi:hypothetical protein
MHPTIHWKLEALFLQITRPEPEGKYSPSLSAETDKDKKVKFSLCLSSQALCYEDIWGIEV